MTREEALKNLVTYAYFVDELPEEVAKSLDMAIEALKEQGEREKERAFAEHLRDRGY